MRYLVYLAVDRGTGDCVHNLDREGDAAGVQVLSEQALSGPRGNEHGAGVQVFHLQALVPQNLQQVPRSQQSIKVCTVAYVQEGRQWARNSGLCIRPSCPQVQSRLQTADEDADE